MKIKIRTNKVLATILLGAGISGLVLMGCSNNSSKTSDSEQQAQEQEQQNSNFIFEDQHIVSAADPNLCVDIKSETEEIVLASCDIKQPSQKWNYHETNNWLVNTESNLCITKSQSEMKLKACEEATNQQWTYEDGVFAQNGYAFDVNMTEQTIILWQTHGFVNQQWVIPSIATSEIDKNYASKFPMPTWNVDAYTTEQAIDIINRLTPIDQELPFTRDVVAFPGEVPLHAEITSKDVGFNRLFTKDQTKGITQRQHWISTGTYAPAGQTIEIEILNQQIVENLFAIINVHTDILRLDSANTSSTKKIERFPSLSTKIKLNQGLNKVRSQYGGQVIIASEKSEDLDVKIKISNVVETVHFKLGSDTNNDWPAIKEKTAPWGVLEGDHVFLDMSKSELQKIDDPVQLLETFDKTVELIRDLAGFEVGVEGVHKMPTLKERFVSDIQITAGFAHAGYPIMTSPGWKLYSLDTAQNNGWGNWHETGHNYQQFCLWSSAFGTESTVNLFSLYVQEAMNQEPRIQQEQRYTKAINKLKDGFEFSNDSDVWDKLVFLMQIKHGIPDKGWDLFRQLNRRFRELDALERDRICLSDDASFNATFKLLSEISGYDLTQHFKTWGVKLSEESYQYVAELALPYPNTDLSKVNPE